MEQKIKCALVDNDPSSIKVIQSTLQGSSLAELSHIYVSSNTFLKALSKIHFDICFLEICLPETDGIQIAHKLGNKRVVFVTKAYERLKEANDICPLSLLTKPVVKAKLTEVIEIAHRVIVGNQLTEKHKEYELFHIAGEKGKVRIQLADIVFVRTDDSDHRHKRIILKGGEKHILMNCSFEELLYATSSLIRINKSELISLDVFSKIEYDVITLKGVIENGKPKQVTLNRWFRKDFLERTSF